MITLAQLRASIPSLEILSMSGVTIRPSDMRAAHYRAADAWRDSGPTIDHLR